MVATLQSRKEALEAKILEKNEELKKLCLQEADLTGVMPPEIPLEPGEPPPPIRRRIGTSFSFPQNLINNMKDADDESLTALELECKVQTNIAEAALALANDASANKAARRKHRLMYRQSQRRLMELETRLSLLKQGKSQLKPQLIKKKPRPNTTVVENLDYLWNKTNEHSLNSLSGIHPGSWPGKIKSDYSLDDIDGNREFAQQNDIFGSLHRSFKSTTTSQNSGSPRTDIEEEYKQGNNQLFSTNSFPNHLITGFYSHPNVQEIETSKLNLSLNPQYNKRNGKRMARRHWDTQSAGGTLLPSQTYPDHSHQPNLSRTQSLGSMESNPQKSKDSWSVQDFSYEGNAPKEKEWYETSLDSAPSPPLRTTSRLPSTARMLYQMQELQSVEVGNWSNVNNLETTNSHPVLPSTPNVTHKNVVRSASAYPTTEGITMGVDNLTNCIHQIHINPNTKGRSSSLYNDETRILNQNEYNYDYGNNESRQPFDYSFNIPKLNSEEAHFQTELKSKLELSYPSTSNDSRFLKSNESNLCLPLIRKNSLNHSKYKNTNLSDSDIKKLDCYKSNSIVYANISEDNVDLPMNNWLNDEEFANQKRKGQIAVPQEYVVKAQTPTQPYYHVTKHSPGEKIKNLQYQAAISRHATIAEEQGNYHPPSPIHSGTHHPPHAITQNEISFDTVVPFESPQNHTVVQAGKWQPYREVTKPFEMSDFYKYSTKFRQKKSLGNRPNTPDGSRNSPNAIHQKGVYTPLQPMTCRPVESRSNQVTVVQADIQNVEEEKSLVEVSPPEIV